MRFAFKPGPPERLSISLQGRDLPVAVKRHAGAKRLILRLDARTGSPVVTLPRRTSLRDAQRFLERHAGWLEMQVGDQAATPLLDGATIPVRGRPCRVVATGRRGLVRHLTGEAGDRMEVPGAPEHLPRRVTDWLKREARVDLRSAVDRYAGRLGRSPPRLRVGDPKSRWGSCSSQGAIALSWRLVLAPPHVLAYVAAHEVAHLEEMNHGRSFWEIVRRLDPEFQASRRWLKANGAALHAVGRASVSARTDD